MNKSVGTALAALFLSGSVFTLFTPRAHAQSGPEVVYEIYHDTSLPVREYLSGAVETTPAHRVHPLPSRVLPGPVPSQPDTTEQALALPLVAAGILRNFDGIPDAANGNLESVPPDENLSVGATQVVEVINTAYQVFNKSTGASVQGPRQISRIFTGMSGLCGQGATFNFTDPIVLYDKKAGRWFISIVASNSSFTTGNECIAVSTTSDATGSYHRYAFGFGSDVFNDYPKFGVWPDAYYGSYNLFGPTSFIAAEACAYTRSAMLAGLAAKAICFKNPSEFSLLPSDLDGATLPPTGEPNFFVDLATTTALHLFRFHVNFTTPSSSSFTGPITIPVAPFAQACGSKKGTCIPQAGTKQLLDSLGDRLMFRLAYRNFGTHESLVVNHSVTTSVAQAGVRWYEIRSPNSAPTVFQQGTLTNGSLSLWMGSIATDKVGDMAVGFSESSNLIHPRIAFTGRVPGDPKGTMEGIATIFSGPGSQTGGTVNGGNRWGDYSSIALDPANDCTFWYVNEYLPANGLFNFHTRIAAFKFPGCI